MTTINTQERKGSNGTSEFILLPSDVYRMKIASAAIEEDKFAEPLNDGTRPEKLVLSWEVTQVTEDQDERYMGAKVWQRFNPWYGNVKAGGPSLFKALIDKLREQGLLPDFNPAAFTIEELVGIEQRVSVEEYAKTMGANKGQPGNKITQVMPIKRQRAVQTEKPAKPATPVRNVPQALANIEERDLPF